MSRFSSEETSSVEKRRIKIVGHGHNRGHTGAMLHVQITNKVLVIICEEVVNDEKEVCRKVRLLQIQEGICSNLPLKVLLFEEKIEGHVDHQ